MRYRNPSPLIALALATFIVAVPMASDPALQKADDGYATAIQKAEGVYLKAKIDETEKRLRAYRTALEAGRMAGVMASKRYEKVWLGRALSRAPSAGSTGVHGETPPRFEGPSPAQTAVRHDESRSRWGPAKGLDPSHTVREAEPGRDSSTNRTSAESPVPEGARQNPSPAPNVRGWVAGGCS